MQQCKCVCACTLCTGAKHATTHVYAYTHTLCNGARHATTHTCMHAYILFTAAMPATTHSACIYVCVLCTEARRAAQHSMHTHPDATHQSKACSRATVCILTQVEREKLKTHEASLRLALQKGRLDRSLGTSEQQLAEAQRRIQVLQAGGTGALPAP